MRRSRVLAFTLLVAAGLAACGEGPVTPTPPEANESLLSLGLFKSATVARRTTPLARDEVVSKVIGPLGGTLELPAAGLTVAIPVGALQTAVEITVTAPAGDLVGYHFEPHGLQFSKPVVALQRTSGTELGLLRALLSRPYGAYFEGELAPKVRALEILDLRLLDLLGLARFQIRHFSGYVIAMD